MARRKKTVFSQVGSGKSAVNGRSKRPLIPADLTEDLNALQIRIDTYQPINMLELSDEASGLEKLIRDSKKRLNEINFTFHKDDRDSASIRILSLETQNKALRLQLEAMRNIITIIAHAMNMANGYAENAAKELGDLGKL